jgi:hypothetical protein
LEAQSEYRVGSPFAEIPATGPNDNDLQTPHGTDSPLATSANFTVSVGLPSPETIGDGVWGHTAEAALFASIMLSVFAAACWFFFPPGGIAVAALGVAVSLLALASTRTKLTASFLAVHGIFFILCYLKSI